VEIRKVNLGKFFKLNESLESKIIKEFFLQNTSHITQKGKNTQTYSDMGGIQRL